MTSKNIMDDPAGTGTDFRGSSSEVHQFRIRANPRHPYYLSGENFAFLFGFVSDFDIRISDLVRLRRSANRESGPFPPAED